MSFLLCPKCGNLGKPSKFGFRCEECGTLKNGVIQKKIDQHEDTETIVVRKEEKNKFLRMSNELNDWDLDPVHK